MRYVVLHRDGTTWVNRYGNGLHVPFIHAGTVEEAVEEAIDKTGCETPMYLTFDVSIGKIVKPLSGWKVEPFGAERVFPRDDGGGYQEG